jgi:hypothetical protein
VRVHGSLNNTSKGRLWGGATPGQKNINRWSMGGIPGLYVKLPIVWKVIFIFSALLTTLGKIWMVTRWTRLFCFETATLKVKIKQNEIFPCSTASRLYFQTSTRENIPRESGDAIQDQELVTSNGVLASEILRHALFSAVVPDNTQIWSRTEQLLRITTEMMVFSPLITRQWGPNNWEFYTVVSSVSLSG